MPSFVFCSQENHHMRFDLDFVPISFIFRSSLEKLFGNENSRISDKTYTKLLGIPEVLELE